MKQGKVVHYFPTYTTVKYYRGYRKSFGEKTGWTNYRFHLGLFALIGLYFLCAVGLKTLLTTPAQLNATVQAATPTLASPSATDLAGHPVHAQGGEILVDDEIRQVFGEDAPKAFELLSCENPTHDPNLAINATINHPYGSRDLGVFSINEYWTDVNAKFLLNQDINIRIAKQLYDENNHTFSLWVCGQRMGI